MLKRSFNPAKCKTSLKLATSRIKLMKNKRENHLKQLKRELAQLLESGQDQAARVRVEHVVREEKTIAAYDLIDLYCEVIVARLPIIESQKNCPIDLKEAVTSVVFASPRCADIPELQDARKHFTAKYGKEFVNAALEMRPDCGVSRMLVEKLSANAPDGPTKVKILAAIAVEHNVTWDPKSFGEKESKPYDDLLKGPNTFDKANKMHFEPPIPQAHPPNVHVPQSRDQRHDAPVNYQQNFHSSNSQKTASSDFNGGQSAPSPAPHTPLRPSGTEYQRTETRHSHPRDENAYSTDKQNCHMEFKDATAAAQAAAESAERASMAARAAVHLSSHESITRRHSNESHKSNADSQRDDKPRESNDWPSKSFVKNANTNSFEDRNQKFKMRAEKVDGYEPKSDYNADERFNQSASAGSETASVSVKDKRPVNNFHEVDRYSQKSSFKEEIVKPENSASISSTRVNKPSRGQKGNNYFRSSSSDNEDSDVISTGGPVFDKQPQYDEQVSNFYTPSITRKPSNHFAVDADKKSPKTPKSALPDDLAPVVFDDSHGSSSDSEDEVETSSFRGKVDPTIRSYKEDRKSTGLGKDHGLKGSYSNKKTDSDQSRKQNLQYSSDDSDYTEVYGENKSRTKTKVSPNEITHRLSPHSSRVSSLDEVKDEDDLYTSVTINTMKNEVFDQSRSESGKEFEFSTFTGGLRNKGYKAPPYTKSPSGDKLSSKVAAEDKPIYTEKTPASSNAKKDNLSSRTQIKNHDLGMNDFEKESPHQKKDDSTSRTRIRSYDLGRDDFQEEPPRHQKDNSSSRNRIKSYDLGEDDFEEKPPQQKKDNSGSRNRIKSYDLDKDDFEEEPQQQKKDNLSYRNRNKNHDLSTDSFLGKTLKQEKREKYPESKFSAPARYFDSDDNDSEEELPEQPSTVKINPESGISRRTKENTNLVTTVRPKTKHESPVSVNSNSVSKNKPVVSEKHSTTRPGREEKHKPSAMQQPPSPLKTTTSAGEAKPSHVHPNLPDCDSFADYFHSLRRNSG